MEGLKLNDLEKFYEDFSEFLENKNFYKEYDNLVASRPFLSIEKNAEYTILLNGLLYEFLTIKGYTTITPMLLNFISNFHIDWYPKLFETLKECYR